VQIARAIVILAPVYLGGCAASEHIQLKPGISSCVDISGLQGLRVYVWRDGGLDEFSFDKGMLRQSAIDSGPERRIPRNDPDVLEKIEVMYPSEGQLLPSGERLGFPAAQSPDRLKWAAGVRSNNPLSPTEFVIREGAAVHRHSSLPGFRVETLAWSPQSDRLAIIERNFDNRARTPLDLISAHGVQYSDLVLSIYAASGKIVCQSLIASKRRTPQPKLEWMPR
jgi:hypothetical protein